VTGRSLVVLLALHVGPSAFGQAAADRIEGAVPEEVDAFRASAERFTDRLREFGDDTRAFVAMREKEERDKLIGGYDALLDSLESVEKDQRGAAIERFETFLAQYPDSNYGSHVRFRLADLHFEVASEAYLAASKEYFDKSDDPNLTLEELESLGEEPKLDLEKPIALYERILEDNRALPPEEQYEGLDGVFLMLAFCYIDKTSAQQDEGRARDVFASLIEIMPDSDLADRSHLFLGNFLFADSDYDAAIREYRLVYDRGQDSPYFGEAIYQLAWGHYKQNAYEPALKLFTELLDLSEEEKRNTGQDSAFAPDSLRFMAFSFADIAYDGEQNAVQIAEEFFGRAGSKAYEWDVYVELADVLIRYTRPEEAIEVYQKLQNDPRWEFRPENPEFQIQVIDLYSTNPLVRDLVKSGAERLTLTERYNEGTPWWEQNRNNPEALATARNYIETSLLDVAVEYYVRAQESLEAQDFALAAAKYREYLEKFPISDDYYKQQWYLATALRRSSQFDEADAEYQSLLRSSRYHVYGDGALFNLFDVRYNAMLAAGMKTEDAPTDPTVERTYESAGGAPVDVYELAPARTAFLESVDEVLAHSWAEEVPEDTPDYGAATDEKRAVLMYLPAQMLFYHNRYEEARPRFEALIDQFPRTDEASFAASLLVNSYLAEGDLPAVRLWTRKFATMILGTAEVPDQSFTDTLEGTTFKLAGQLAGDGQLVASSEAYLSFIEEFPESQYAADALYNAAFYLQEAGKFEQANGLYERFVRDYPLHERSRALYFRIAANYESTFDLNEAVRYYEELVGNFPEDVNAPDAKYNAAFLRTGLKDYQGAAEGFEEYARTYPDAPDREQVYFLAGRNWEEVDPGRAESFYLSYLREYGVTVPDHALEAESRLAELYRDKGDEGAVEKQLDKIVETFKEIVAGGGEIGPAGHGFAAESEYRNLQAAFDALTAEKLTGDEDRDTALLTEIKPIELKEFEAKADAFVAMFRNFEYSSGALFLKGMASLYYADLGLSLKPPEGLEEEQQWAYLDLLEEKVFPQYYAVEEVSLKRLRELTEVATSNKRYSRFVELAYAELNRRKPSDYPDVKGELVGGVEARMPARIVPYLPDVDAEPEPPAEVDDQTPPPGAPEPAPEGDQPAEEAP
jgi:cellulose synthase operon protein C